MKKKNLMPLIVFLLSMCLVGFIVYKTDTHEKWQRRTTSQLNVSTYGERIKNEITNGIAITDTLKQVLISGNGDIKQFDAGFSSGKMTFQKIVVFFAPSTPAASL